MSGRELVRVICGESGCGRKLGTVEATAEGLRWDAWLPAAEHELGSLEERTDRLHVDPSTDDGPDYEVRCARHPLGGTVPHRAIVAAIRRAARPGGGRQKLPVPDRPRPVETLWRPSPR